MKLSLTILAIALSVPALASEPGQPLDCSDWVFLVPGLYCTTIAPFGTADSLPNLNKGVQQAADNTGALYFLRETAGYGTAWTRDTGELDLVRSDGATQT